MDDQVENTEVEQEAPVEQAAEVQEPIAEVPAEVAEVAETETNAEKETEEVSPLQAVVKEFFSPADAEKAKMKVNELLENGIIPKFNFDPKEDTVPDTHGLLITPIAKRVEGETINIGVLVAAIPTVAAIAAYGDEGQAFIENAAESFLFAKISNAVRPRDGVESLAEIPFSIDSFITKRTLGDGLAAYNKVAPDWVKALKKKGLQRLTTAILRDILSSRANAEHFFPEIPQETWLAIMDKMAMSAIDHEDELDPAIYENWKNERDNVAGLHEVADINLDDLSI